MKRMRMLVQWKVLNELKFYFNTCQCRLFNWFTVCSRHEVVSQMLGLGFLGRHFKQRSKPTKGPLIEQTFFSPYHSFADWQMWLTSLACLLSGIYTCVSSFSLHLHICLCACSQKEQSSEVKYVHKRGWGANCDLTFSLHHSLIYCHSSTNSVTGLHPKLFTCYVTWVYLVFKLWQGKLFAKE